MSYLCYLCLFSHSGGLYCYHFVDISAGGLFVPESIIHPCTFKCFGQLFTFPLYFERTL
jgi:hypothetical protein